jgi:MFS family permease
LAAEDTVSGVLAGESQPSNQSRLLGSTFASFADRDFAWFFSGNLAFFMAMQMQFILFGYLTFEITDSAKALGVIAAAFALPTLFAGPVSGVIVDRVNKRLLLNISSLVATLMALTLGVLVISGAIEFWHLVVASIAVGLLMSIIMPARQALVPQLVPRHRITNAISLQMGSMNLTRIVAPGAAGLLIAPLGAGWVYVISAVLFFASALLALQLPVHGMTGHRSNTGFVAEAAEGFRYIWRHETVRLLIFTSLLIPMLAFPVQQMLPVFADEVFHQGAAGLGIMAAMSGAGGLIGAVLSANMDKEPHKGRLLLIGGMIMGVFTIGFALSPWFLPALALLVAANVGQMLFMTTNNTVIQANLPAEIRGRVVSVMMMSFGLTPLGVIPVSAAADAIGAPITIACTALIALTVIGLIFTFSARLRNLRLDALERVDLSPVQAAALVAEGRLTEDEARRRTGARSLEEPSS